MFFLRMSSHINSKLLNLKLSFIIHENLDQCNFLIAIADYFL